MSDSPEIIINEDGLDEREVAFLEVLFDTHNGKIRDAMNAVGYPKTASTHSVTKKLARHIQSRSKEYLISQSAQAAISIVGILSDPSAIGAKNLLAASKDILDRASIVKDETPAVTEIRNMFILPAKVEEDE